MNDSNENKKKIKLGIFIPTNLQVGAGVENVAFQMIDNIPKNFKVYLIQTDFFDGKRMSNSEYDYVKEKCQIITLNGFSSISILMKFGLFTPFLIKIVVNILRFKNRKILASMDKLDLVYLTSNWWSGLFSKMQKKIVGSSHTDFGFNDESVVSLLKAKLINSGLLFRSFSAFHTFPGMESMSKYISNKNIGIFLPMGVNTRKYFPRQLNDEINILFVARIVECKGPFIAIDSFEDAMSKMKHPPNIYLTVIGSGPLSEEIRRRTNENVKYCGPVDATKLEELYGKSNLFLAPTKCDTFSIVVLESLASGSHAIISSSLKGRFDDFVKNGYAEYADPNVQTFSKTIESCIAKINDIRNKRTELANFFKQRYDSSVINKNIFDWMEELNGML